jgi:drug/metabolite transporter (DMT)-like permease
LTAGLGDQARWSPAPAAALTVACVLWAGSAIAAKVAIGDGSDPPMAKVGPFALSCLRFAIGGALLFGYQWLRRDLFSVRRDEVGRLLSLGGLGIALTYAVFYGGMRHTTATETTFLVASEPILIAVLARLMLDERLTARQGSGLLVGLIGVYVIVFRGLVPRSEGTVIANGIVTLALVFESYSSIVGKALTRHRPGLTVAAYGMLIGAALLCPAALWECRGRGAWRPGAPEIASVAYLAILCSGVCYGIWYSLLKRYSVSSMAGFLFIQPMVGPVLGYLLLRETMSPWTAIGAAAIVAGLWLIASPRRARAAYRRVDVT